jgi:hypothetical protein
MTLDDCWVVIAKVAYKPGWKLELEEDDAHEFRIRCEYDHENPVTHETRRQAVYSRKFNVNNIINGTMFLDDIYAFIEKVERARARAYFRYKGRRVKRHKDNEDEDSL